MTEAKALDLFCGAAGGWSVALHANGIDTVAACEIDGWRRAAFSKNFPKAKIYDDIKTLTASRLIDDLGYLPTIIVGSPPCQDASVANSKGNGVDGERTGLFFEAVRLVREVRPAWACFENVPGLRTRGFDRIQDELEAAHYTVWPLVVGAWHTGAPHRRNRVWIISISDTASDRCGERRKPGSSRQGRELATSHQQTITNTGGANAVRWSEDGGRRGWSQALAKWQNWNGGPPEIGGMDDGLPKGMARKMLSAYGDAVVPQVAAAVVAAIVATVRVDRS
jgi:DNA (cytosine-5)-methyltransferase 1